MTKYGEIGNVINAGKITRNSVALIGIKNGNVACSRNLPARFATTDAKGKKV